MNHIFSLCATVVIVGHINYLCKDTIIEIHVMNYHRVSPSDKNVLFIPCLFLLLLCHIAGFAQDTDPFSYNAFSIPSANSAEMIRYGDLKPSLYTGAMEYSYHVYSYLDEDFTIPISLDYHFDGYRPSQHSGPYGMGWSLETTPFTGGRFIKNATGNFTEQRHITDHLGSTRAIVEGANYTEVEQNDYFPYGKRITDIALPITASNRWRFSGKEIQTLGGVNLIDFGARLYDEFTGRWKTQDVLSEWLSSVSPYSFCRCNSINRIDPTGMDDYRYDDKTGNFILMEKTDDETDRVLGYHYNKRKGEYEKNTKLFQMKIRMEGIEKGILNDGINFKNNDNLIIVGGYGHASVEGVESFVVKMSNMVRKEIGGAYFAKDGANSTTHITVGRYKNNTHTENRSGHGHNLWNKLFPNSRLENSLTGFFHTHPSNSSINASIRINPSQQDRNSRNSALEQMPNMQFFILTQPVYPGGDFPLKIDYTYL